MLAVDAPQMIFRPRAHWSQPCTFHFPPLSPLGVRTCEEKTRAQSASFSWNKLECATAVLHANVSALQPGF